MKIAHDLLADLAGIGAAIEIAGDRLILKAGPTAIPASLVNRVREAKRDLIVVLATRRARSTHRVNDEDRQGTETNERSECRTREDFVIQWLDDHPTPSPPGRCAWCGRPESLGAMVVPFGIEPGKHTWLHPECWSPWHRARKAEATSALMAMEESLRG
jgi:hypothetical protein